MKHFRNYILLILAFTVIAYAAKFDTLIITPITSGARPAGVEGQLFSNSTTHGLQYKNNSSWYSLYSTADTTFVGTATNATNGSTVATTTNASFFPLFVASSSNGNQPFNLDTTLTYNPSTDTVSATTFAGNASTATTATNATNVGITDDTTTNATMYPTWVTTTTGNLPQKISSSKLTWNPSSGIFSAPTLSGTLGVSNLNGVVVPSKGGTGVNNNDAATTTRSGNHALTFTTTATSSITLPTQGSVPMSSATSVLKIEAALLNCDSSSQIVSQSGSGTAFSAIGNISAGACAVTLAGWSETPVCVASANLATRLIGIDVGSSTSLTIDGTLAADGTDLTVYNAYVICIGAD